MKHILYLLIILLLISITNQATADDKPLQGQVKIDSLLVELPKAKGDTNEVKLLNNLSIVYRRNNIDKGIEFGLEALELAKDINWKKGESTSYNLLGTCFAIRNKDNSKALEYYQKALEINKEIKSESGIASNLGNIGNVYNNQSNYPKALEYYQRALRINEKRGNKNEISINLTNIGKSYGHLSNYAKAFEYFQKALKLKEELGDKNSVAAILGDIGSVYMSKSDYSMSLEYFQKALKLKEELEDKDGVARLLGNMGTVYRYQSNYPKALEYFQKALEINEELGDKNGVAAQLGNIGIVYDFQSNYPKSLEYYEKSLKIYEEIKSKFGIARSLTNMGGVYIGQKDYPKALEYYQKALKTYNELKDKNSIALTVGNIGIIYFYQSNYPKALEYYQKALVIDEEIGNKNGVARHLGNIGELYLIISQDSVSINPNELNEFVSLNRSINLNRSIEYTLESIEIYEEIGEMDYRSNNLEQLARAYKQKGEYKKWGEALEEHHKLKDSVFNQENSDKIAALEKAREDDLKQKEIEKQKLKIAEQEKREKLILYFSIGFILVMAVVMFVIYRLLKRSDKLLYNVLPVSIAKRLKNKEHPISDYFTQASIVFIDIVNFTEMAKDEDPRKLVEALNAIFTSYDTIANKYGLEKIKTIGDSYMAAAGIPEVQKDNTHRAAQMAIEVKQLMSDYTTTNGVKIEVRIGLDCGPVVAGVIGENKFIYDMWSDAVNTASRMESTSESGQVHITERFKEAVSEYEEFDYVERGEMEIKGKGKMKTYYIENKEVVNV